MPNPPGDKRNLWGCLAIAIILALFVIVYVIVGMSAKPENKAATKIQIAPSGQR